MLASATASTGALAGSQGSITMIERTQLQIYTMHYIIEQNNFPGYRMYMPTYQKYYNTHITCYKDVEYRDIDKRNHGWADVCIKSPIDGSYKYYKFIEVGEPVYKGWLKKWVKIADNKHFLVIYTNEPCITDRKYAIYSFENVSEHINKYFGREDKEKHYIDNFYAKECIKIQFSPITSTRRIKDLKQCFEYAVDNTWEYLTHKSAGYKYIYKGWVYSSLNDLYQNTVYGIKYEKLSSFRSAYQRGKITEVEKVPASYLEGTEELMGGGQPPHTPLSSNDATVKQSKEHARFEGPEAESSLWGLWNEQNENVSHKSEDQMTRQDNKSISTSMWRDESVDANGKEWEHLKILMEQERKNKVIKPVKVYKCSKEERYKKE